MAEAITPEASITRTNVPIPDTLKLAVVAAAVGLVYILSVLFLGLYVGAMPLLLPTLSFLLTGLISSLIGLTRKRHLTSPGLWRYAILLVVILAEVAVTFPRLGLMPLWKYHWHIRIAVTGRQDELRSWANNVLTMPRDELYPQSEEGVIVNPLLIPESHWSRQVARLKPNEVIIGQFSQDDQETVRLCYGSGFQHWYLVIGPPGWSPKPKMEKERPYDSWLRLGDGLYWWLPDY